VPPHGGILRTNDGGATWEDVYQTDRYLWSVFFTDPLTGYVTDDFGGILKTTDGGTTWTELPEPTGYSLYSVFFTSSDTGYVAGGGMNASALLKTTDAGATWMDIDPGIWATLRFIYFFDSKRGYAGGQGGTIFRTKDAGESWYVQDGGSYNDFRTVCFTDTLTGYLGGSFGSILKTNTGGEISVGSDPHKIKAAEGLAISPNPASGIITLEVNNPVGCLRILVFDSRGREVLRKESDQEPVLIDTGNLSPGIYFIKVISGDGIRIGKLVKTE
jgi:photosystem II stability/assembly factor-like uncharacterized protein